MTYDEFLKQHNISLNEQQSAAVQAINGPTLLLAVPGSGKTTVLVTRIGYMIYCCNIDPRSILTVTYTKAAAEDMKKRFIKFFGDKYADELTFCTINSLSNRIMLHYAYCTGKTPFKVADKEALGFVKDAFMRVSGTFATENDVKSVQTAITYVKNMCFNNKQIAEYETDVDDFPTIYSEYNRLLRENIMIDYDDQMVYALQILKNPTIYEHYTNRYLYICVDEAQDTSKIQHEIIHLLAMRSNNLFMVGDEDQSIYGFRAAYPKALTEFERTYVNAKVLLMESNYRSKSEIVKAADKLIQTNKDRHAKHVLPTRSDGGMVKEIPTRRRKEQYVNIVNNAYDLPGKTAVLYRNTESALPLIDTLDRHGLPYTIRQGDGSFFSNPVVLDILDFLSFAGHMNDEKLFMRIYYKLGAYITKQLALEACKQSRGENILNWIAFKSSAGDHIKKKCRDLYQTFSTFDVCGTGNAIHKIINMTGYGEYMEGRGLDKGKADILKIIGDEEPSTERFFKRLEELHQLLLDGVNNHSGLILSTIHSSKGLEYENVYMIDMLKRVLPSCDKPTSVNDKTNEALYEEEKRLYYVGMTRAKENLFIFSTDMAHTSDFTHIVFDHECGVSVKKAPTKKTYSVVDLPVKKPVKPAMSDEEMSSAIEKLRCGAKVEHSKYGIGQVVMANADRVSIVFADGRMKEFATKIALQTGVLKTM